MPIVAAAERKKEANLFLLGRVHVGEQRLHDFLKLVGADVGFLAKFCLEVALDDVEADFKSGKVLVDALDHALDLTRVLQARQHLLVIFELAESFHR